MDGAGLSRLFVGGENLGERAPTKLFNDNCRGSFADIYATKQICYKTRPIPTRSRFGAGLLRLFVGGENLGEPAPTDGYNDRGFNFKAHFLNYD
jgi:hypothetical protein